MTTTSPRPEAVRSAGALAVALALSAGLTTGCSEGFDPYNRLATPRVLAIQSDPVAPAPGETTTLSALLYEPPEDAVASMSWSWCPFAGSAAEGYPCLISEEELAELNGGDSPVPSYDLGDGETATFEHSLDPALLAAVCEGTADQPELLDCEGGFPVQLKLTVESEGGGAGGQRAHHATPLRRQPRAQPQPVGGRGWWRSSTTRIRRSATSRP